MDKSISAINIIFLLVLYLIYSSVGVFTKFASMQEFLSIPYLCYFLCAIVVMGIYAILWQQIIQRMPISTAYMFKGVCLVYMLIIVNLLFNETITWNNIIGSIIIISGITLYAKG